MRARWRSTVVVVAMVAAACGNTVVGDGGDEGRPKLPIGSGGSMAGGASAATMRAEVASDASGVAPSMAPIRPVEYRLAEGAEAPARDADAYQLRLVKDGVAERVAKALGVDAGDIDIGSGYGDWWYSDEASANTAVSSTAVADCPPDVKCETPEPSPAPKLEGVPLPEDAKAKAKAILDELGVSLEDADLDIQGDDGYFRTVTYTPSVGGVPVPMMASSITFGAHSRIQYANGFLFEVDGLGRYPLVSLAEAFDRHQQGFGTGGVQTMESGVATADPGVVTPTPEPEPDCAADGPGCSVPGSSGSTGAEPAPDRGAPVTIEPAPDPAAPLEPEIVEVTGARLVLEPVATGCLDDPIYLVPAFELLLDEAGGGPIGTVTAVTDDALDTRDPSEATPRACPEDEVEDLPAGKPEPAPLPPDAGSVEPQPAPARNP